jgi:signal transduction histidine kinase
MTLLAEKNVLGQRACWLIRLRWLAAGAVALGAFVFARVLPGTVRELPLYSIALFLVLYNASVKVWLLRLTGFGRAPDERKVKAAINLQIAVDLLLLTVLLHFSGGPENPFVFFFIFHMIIASILLSVWESYVQATVAVLLFGLLLILEFSGAVPHHCLAGVVVRCRYEEPVYLLGLFAVFALTLYLVVYMASYVAVRLRRAEQAQRLANRSLCQKDRVKDEYVAHLTHDIKGHLAAIQSCLGVAVGGVSNGRSSEFVERAYRRTKKLTAFVGMLLKLTRLRLEGNLEMRHFSLADTLQTAVEAIRPRAEDKSLPIECNIEPEVAAISGDRDAMLETLTNVLMNAVEYTPERGRISVSAGDRDRSVVVEITDTGIGIPEAEKARIFEEFYRAGNARKIEREGTGLGLSLAKHIVELHGGTIDFSSTLGRGTTFRIVLPAARRRSPAEPVLTGMESHGLCG